MRVAAAVVFAVALLVSASAADFPEEDSVLVLGDDNIEDALAAHDTLLVEFYAPWCGHCKKLAPEYARAAKTLKKEGIRIGKVDATENAESAEKYGVEGYPTLKFFKGGRATEYSGGRTEKDIVAWVKKHSGPPAKTIESADEAKTFSTATDVAVIGVFASADGADAKAFLHAAAQSDDVSFAISTTSAVATEFGASVPSVILFKKFDEGRNDFSGEYTSDAIAKFVSSNALPLVVPFTQETAPKIFGGPLKTHLLVFTDADESSTEYAGVKEAAKEIKGKLLTVTVASSNDRVLNYFGITKGEYPTAVIVNMPEGAPLKKYLQGTNDITGSSLTAFVNKYTAGELKPHLKSDPEPTEETGPGVVKVLVGTTFDKVVNDDSKDVLVEFYAPWCRHCKQLAPIYDKLAERFAKVPSVVIAKMDATANEVDDPNVNVQGFPTIIFFPAGENKKAMNYDGSRDLDGFTDFLKENAQVKFTLNESDDGDDTDL